MADVLERQSLGRDAVDPDPFTIAACAFAGVAVVLQLLQTVKTYQRPPRLALADHERSRLNAILNQVEQVNANFERLVRIASRESRDADRELFGAPARVARTELLLAQSAMSTFGSEMSATYTSIGGLANWIVSTIGNSPDLAARLGDRIKEPLGDVAERLNVALAEGRSTGEIISEFRLVLHELAAAIEQELQGN